MLNLRNGVLVSRELIAENFGMPEEYRTLVNEYIQTRTLPEDVSKYLQDFED